MTIVKTKYWSLLDNGKVRCDVCPRFCQLAEGQRGHCFVRGREDNEIVLMTHNRSSGFCIDPIEKKPLNHFYPGSAVLSFGTAGCNLACRFCQNWDITKSRQLDILQSKANAFDIVKAAKESGCLSIAFTYNDPVIFLEYAKEVAELAQLEGIKTVAVTAGYINPRPREEFFSFIDAVNVDLKAFTDDFYQKLTGAHLQNVLETLIYIKKETKVWLEITTLLIPGMNDSPEEIDAMTKWIFQNLGPDIPLHLTAFHPDWKMRDTPSTGIEILQRSREIALKNNLNFVYTGNVHDPIGSSTYCPRCHETLIERDWFELGKWKIDSNGSCGSCGYKIKGKWDERPGDWGSKRQVLSI
jgi:pyruvate formate lyase activating enzyme